MVRNPIKPLLCHEYCWKFKYLHYLKKRRDTSIQNKFDFRNTWSPIELASVDLRIAGLNSVDFYVRLLPLPCKFGADQFIFHLIDLFYDNIYCY
jgi:hypothetical protein